MITSVEFKNFRGFSDLTLPLSQVTMLTGTNGVGKTSVLEGLYCLFSETRLDVSPLARYNKTMNFVASPSINPLGLAVRPSYNYKLFWDECPSYERTECSVKASSDNGFSWGWEYKKARLNDLDKKLTANNRIPVDSTSEFALWNWFVDGVITDPKTHQPVKFTDSFNSAQVFLPDGGLYLLPLQVITWNLCKYLDFASIRLQPQRLSYPTSKELTKALQVINPHVTDVRLTDTVSGLSIVLDNDKSATLGTLGNGAVTWVSVLTAIFDVLDDTKKDPQSNPLPSIILIDEMGAGINYNIMRDIWKYIREFMKQNSNIQFVFTSHSDDCIEAYCEAFLNTKDVASVVRLHKTAVGKKNMYTKYSESVFENIINGEWEVRG